MIFLHKPKILISGNKNLQYYVDAVNNAGGISEASYLPKIDTNYDGLILCGGNDINPEYYGEAINGAVNIDYKRDEVEFALLKAFVDAGKPVFGICRGCQLINVFFGGSLYQDIENVKYHRDSEATYIVHNVKATTGSIAEKLYGTEFVINSFHHQAIKKLGNDLKISMLAEDDIIEGIEHKTLPVFAVQWHPEKLCLDDDTAVNGAKIFEHFIKICCKAYV